MTGVYELQCQLRVNDGSALWDIASVTALSYPDVTLETVVEMIGPREDIDIADCLLLLLQSSIRGCELLALSCALIPDERGLLAKARYPIASLHSIAF